MEPFVTLRAVAVPVDIANCDTDQIIPARFLRRLPSDGGYDRFLFHDLRFDADGAVRPDFVLNRPEFRGGRIIVADVNWGCGSSRENAVYALLANGIRCVVAPSFGDIHYNNCIRHGVLPVRLPRATCDAMRAALHAAPGGEVTVDLPAQQVVAPDGATHRFEIDAFDKKRLLEGLDDVGLTLGHEAAILAFEARQAREHDWI
ncbi:MAG: 3-isopropylmalate dehydratase small subunit [Ectothiorhodospiraceae bacterium]|nr:3-isopropylmalate dehydratase small subunit [Ectothiorhodospiraceae bacterium]